MRKALEIYDRVTPVGAGHSYNKVTRPPPTSQTHFPTPVCLFQGFFCAKADFENGETAADIVMTDLNPQKYEVNEEEMSVWVSAGTITWDLMAFLGDYVTDAAPRGS